jgi:4-amino-4-deoxy-L-arabinose transferase-like glycosyltransferase
MAPSKKNIALIIIVSGVILIPGLFLRDFSPINELKYILIAKEMFVQNKWFILFEHGQFYTDKPPFFFWLINLTKILTGTYSLGIIGFFSVIPSTLVAITAYFLVKRYVDVKSALPAALMLMSTAGYLVAGSCIRMDMLMSCLIILSLTIFFQVYDRYHRTGEVEKKAYFIYLFIGLAILIKGPAGLIVPLLTITAFLLLVKDINFARKIHAGPGVLIVVAIFLLWIIPAAISGGKEYLDLLLIKQTVGRSINAYAHKEPFYYYLEKSPEFFFPWFLLFALTVCYYLFNLKKANPFEKFLLAWVTSTFVFFSLVSSKLEIYLLPMVFPLPLLSLCLLKRTLMRQRVLLSISVGLPGFVLALLPLAILLLDKKIALINLREDFLFGSVLVSLCSLVCIYYSFKNNSSKAIALLAAAIFILTINFEMKVTRYNPIIGFKDMSQVINRIQAEEAVGKIFTYCLSEGKYMSVYIDRQVEFVTGLEPVGKSRQTDGCVLIFSKAKHVNQLLRLANARILYKNPMYVLVGIDCS